MKTLMAIVFTWTLIIQMETGQKITVSGIRSKERCEAIGFANNATPADMDTLRTFECIEEGKK